MKVTPLELEEVLLIEPDVHGDERGFFTELWSKERYAGFKIDQAFVQDNLSRSRRHTIRGLHFQEPDPQGKLVSVLAGSVFDVVADLRRGSPTFGRWVGVTLSAENRHQLWVPAGFAHGFCVTSETADFHYKCTAYWKPENERVVRFDSPELGIVWPTDSPILSERDRLAPSLAEAPVLPQYRGQGGQ